jgi:hypothetical protein
MLKHLYRNLYQPPEVLPMYQVELVQVPARFLRHSLDLGASHLCATPPSGRTTFRHPLPVLAPKFGLSMLNLLVGKLAVESTRRPNSSNQRRQMTFNSVPVARNCPLHLSLWGDRTEVEDIHSASALGRRVGDDHALGDIRCLLTYRFAPPCASLSNESSEVGAATPSIIFSP